MPRTHAHASRHEDTETGEFEQKRNAAVERPRGSSSRREPDREEDGTFKDWPVAGAVCD